MDKFSTLRILDDNVLLIPYTKREHNGVILTAKSIEQEVKNICMVSALGPDVQDKENLKEGTIVLIPRHTGKKVPFNDFEYYLVKESDILAVLEPEDE